MREEEFSRKKSKGQRLFSQGVVILVCLILAAQAVFFVKYLVESGSPVPSPEPKEEPPSVEVKELESGGSTGTPDTPARTDHKPDHKKEEYRNGPDSAELKIKPHDGWSWDRVELNSADSAALDALPGIGPYYARQIIAYRERIGFYADISQLMDIRGFDSTRLSRLAGRIYIDPASLRHIDFYTMSTDSLASHPYIGPYAAKGIDRLRRTVTRENFTMQAIIDSRILTPAQARRLALYF